MEKTRIDKWLWMVRLFKTRTMANEACLAGKVKIQGNNVKPSKEVVPNLVITVTIGQLQKTIEVIGSPKNRISAGLVPDYYIDRTPQAEYDRVKTLVEKCGHPAGIVGVVVSVYSSGPACEVELWDEYG